MFGWWKKRAPKIDTPPAPLTAAVSEAAPHHESSMDESDFKCEIGLHSDVGCVRTGNEDAARAIVPDDAQQRAQRGVLVVVADGMGGHASGEIASEMAVEIVCRDYYRASAKAAQAPSSVLRAALQAANAAIQRTASGEKNQRRMGTTCTALVVRGAWAFVAHAGDSRLYLVRGDAIYQLSQDHSAVMELVRQGALTAQQARNHPDKNLITRALGLHGTVEIEVWEEPMAVRDEDRFVLCSDGLSDLLEDEEIKRQVLAGPPQGACEALVEHAKARGGHDNITVAILHARAASIGERRAAAEFPNQGVNEPPTGSADVPVTRESAALVEETTS